MSVRRSAVRSLCQLSVAIAPLFAVGCIHIVVDPSMRAVWPSAGSDPRSFTTPVKVHVVDGSIVLFRKGATVSSSEIRGDGVRFPVLSDSGRSIGALPIDSVASITVFYDRPALGPTYAASIGASALVGLALALSDVLFP